MEVAKNLVLADQVLIRCRQTNNATISFVELLKGNFNYQQLLHKIYALQMCSTYSWLCLCVLRSGSCNVCAVSTCTQHKILLIISQGFVGDPSYVFEQQTYCKRKNFHGHNFLRVKFLPELIFVGEGGSP